MGDGIFVLRALLEQERKLTVRPGRAPCFLTYDNPQQPEAHPPTLQLRKWRLIGVEEVTFLQRHSPEVGGLASKN